MRSSNLCIEVHRLSRSPEFNDSEGTLSETTDLMSLPRFGGLKSEASVAMTFDCGTVIFSD